jgi:catabolite regulation protein CreA
MRITLANKKRNTLIYLAISENVIEGSPENCDLGQPRQAVSVDYKAW